MKKTLVFIATVRFDKKNRNQTPLRAYQNYGLEINGFPNHFKTYRFSMRPRSGLIKTVVCRAVVRKSKVKVFVFE